MFWDTFVALCAKQNKSPNAVISEIGCASSAAVTGWKKGAQPRAKVLKMIADYFDIPVSELVEDEKGPIQIQKPTMLSYPKRTKKQLTL
ncbi:MAG: hypothetical protein LUE06_09795 [Oscillospiraceae bacterium]|nr:hypothetical protein [Oscillospiraceae bacterium]